MSRIKVRMSLTTIIIFGAIFMLTLAGGFYLFFIRDVNSSIVGSLIFFVIGVTLIAAGAALAWNDYRFLQHAESVPGVIVSDGKGLERDSDGRFIDVYAPAVRFVDSQGRTFVFNISSSRYREYETGDQVEVLYLPEQPKEARIKRFPWIWLVAAGLAGMSFVFFGIAFRTAFAGEPAP